MVRVRGELLKHLERPTREEAAWHDGTKAQAKAMTTSSSYWTL